MLGDPKAKDSARVLADSPEVVTGPVRARARERPIQSGRWKQLGTSFGHQMRFQAAPACDDHGAALDA